MIALQPFENRCSLLEIQATEKDAHIGEQKSRLIEASSEIIELRNHVHTLQLELATAQAKLEAQQAIAMEWRAFIVGNEQKTGDEKVGKLTEV